MALADSCQSMNAQNAASFLPTGLGNGGSGPVFVSFEMTTKTQPHSSGMALTSPFPDPSWLGPTAHGFAECSANHRLWPCYSRAQACCCMAFFRKASAQTKVKGTSGDIKGFTSNTGVAIGPMFLLIVVSRGLVPPWLLHFSQEGAV